MGVLPEEDLVLSLFSHLKTHPFIPSQEGNLSMTCSKRRRIFHISSKMENLSVVCLTEWRFALIVIVVLAIQDGELISCPSKRVEHLSSPPWRGRGWVFIDLHSPIRHYLSYSKNPYFLIQGGEGTLC